MPKSYWIGYFRTDRVSGLGCQKKTDSSRNSEKAARIETEVKILHKIINVLYIYAMRYQDHRRNKKF